ncbi:MAG TPA: hypothetical protein VIY48_04050 [Candidatus Paceibacterota bacterium]
MTAWVLWAVFLYGASGIASSAALYPTQEMCEAAATKLKDNINRVQTVCTETRMMR